MTQNNILPGSRAALVNADGSANNAYYKFFLSLTSQLTTVVASVKGKADASITVTGYDSIAGGGDLTVNRSFALVGDVIDAPALSFYGALSDQKKGWQVFSSNFQQLTGYLTTALDLSDTGVTAGTYGDATHIPVPTIDAKGRVTGITSIPIGSGTSLNYLINGWLQHWQYGTSFTTAGTGIGPDGFTTFFSGASCLTSRVTCPPGTFDGDPDWLAQYVVAAGIADTDFCQVFQLVEDVRTLAGRSVTFSLQVMASVNCSISMELLQQFGNGAGTNSAIGSTKTALFAGVVTTLKIPVDVPEIPSSMVFGTAKTDYLAAVVWFDAGAFFSTRSANLGHQSATFQIGTLSLVDSSSVIFDRPDEATELVRCQRFFEKSFPHGTAPAQNAGTDGCVYVPQVVGASLASSVGHVSFKTTKRALPTVVTYNPNAANAQVRNASTASDWTLTSVVFPGDGGFGVAATSPSGSAVGQPALFHWSADASLSGAAISATNFLSPDGVQGFMTDTGAILIP